jgi:hypothetical protein
MGATRILATFVKQASVGDIPTEAVATAKLLMLDSIGVALAATEVPGAQIAVQYARALEARPVSTVIGGGFKTSAADAAFDAALLGGLCAGLGGVAWWSSKLIGRSFSELGRPLALLLGGGAFVAAVPELIAGFLDQPGGGFQASFDTIKDGVELSNLISAIGLCLVALGVLGFIAGLLFSGVIRFVEGRRRFDQMSLPRFAAWGAGVGFALSGTFFLAVSRGDPSFLEYFLSVGPIVSLVAAGCAAGSLALARRSRDRELLETPDDAPALGRQAGEVRGSLRNGL